VRDRGRGNLVCRLYGGAKRKVPSGNGIVVACGRVSVIRPGRAVERADIPGAKVDVTWTCGLHVLLFLRFAVWLGRGRTTRDAWFLTRLGLVAKAYPGNNMMHNESVGMEKKGERERDPPGAARGGCCVGMRE